MPPMLPGSDGCCLPTAEGITYLKIGPQAHTIGMRGLDLVFQQLSLMQRNPSEVTDEELVGMARRFNWIPEKPAIEADYALALRQAYAAYYARLEKPT